MAFPSMGPLSLSTADLSECVPGTEHSIQSLIDALRKDCPKFKQMEEQLDEEITVVERVKANSIDGQGLMSSIFRLSIRFHGDARFDAIFKVTTTKKLEKIKPMEIMALKKANGTTYMEKLRTLLFEMSQLEANFYEMVIPRLPADCVAILPEAFVIRRSPDENQLELGFALIEDLSPMGIAADLYKGLTSEQVESALVHLAKFHAYSLTLPTELMDRFHVEHYGDLGGLEEEIQDRVLTLGSRYMMRNQKMLEAFLDVHHTLKTDVHTRMGIRPVLSHGDFWANNLFFAKRADGSAGAELCAIIDWQTPHANTGVNDVLRLIFSSVNAPLRKERLWQWLDLYFDTIQTESARLCIHPPVEYSAELRRALYAEQCHFELTFTLLALPTLFPGAKTKQQEQNLMERIETLFEEHRAEYKQLRKAAKQAKRKKAWLWRMCKTI